MSFQKKLNFEGLQTYESYDITSYNLFFFSNLLSFTDLQNSGICFMF